MNQKAHFFTLDKRLEMIRELYKNEPRVRVESYDSLTIEFARKLEHGTFCVV